jgi:hypothetical protein
MAIIKCPECGHDVSDQAPFCPQCGVRIAGNVTTTPPPVPNPAPTAPPTSQANNEEPKKSNKTTIIISIIIALVVCGAMYYFYSDAQSSKEKEAYEYAMQSSDPMVLQSYLDTYLDAPEAHRDSIQAHLGLLKAGDEEWTNALVSGSKAALEAYLEKYPDSPHKSEAKHKIDSLDWVTASNLNSAEGYQKYLEEHPEGDYVDDAKDGLKGAKAKTVLPEEEAMINSTFRTFFQAINTRDEASLTSCVSTLMTSFLGKSDATKSDVRTFLQKIYKDDVQSMLWRLNKDYKIEKKEVGDDEYEYTVEFSAVQHVESTDESRTGDNHFRIHAKVGPDEKITMLTMKKIVQ